jgi:hypothetical protein
MSLIGTPRKGFNVLEYNRQKFAREMKERAAKTCGRFIGTDGYLVCDRCGSMWSPLLHGTGWLPLSCPDRKMQTTALPSGGEQ